MPLLLGRADCGLWAGESEMIGARLGRATPRSLRRQAVDLHETTPGATVRRIAQDPGVEPGPLRQRLARYRTGRKTGADGRSGLCEPLATRTLPPRPPRCQQVGAL